MSKDEFIKLHEQQFEGAEPEFKTAPLESGLFKTILTCQFHHEDLVGYGYNHSEAEEDAVYNCLLYSDYDFAHAVQSQIK